VTTSRSRRITASHNLKRLSLAFVFEAHFFRISSSYTTPIMGGDPRLRASSPTRATLSACAHDSVRDICPTAAAAMLYLAMKGNEEPNATPHASLAPAPCRLPLPWRQELPCPLATLYPECFCQRSRRLARIGLVIIVCGRDPRPMWQPILVEVDVNVWCHDTAFLQLGNVGPQAVSCIRGRP
jgi:hypothetical protein